MTDIRNDDLLDEINCVDSCEAIISLCELVDNLVKEIQHLELECISTRYLLSQHMDEEPGKLLQMDILENLGRRFRDDPAYMLYRNVRTYGLHDVFFYYSYNLRTYTPCSSI